MEKRKRTIALILIVVSMFLTISFYPRLLDIVSKDFVEKIVITIAISIFATSTIGFQIDEKSKLAEFKKDLITASIVMMVSILLNIFYLSDSKDFIPGMSLGDMGLIFFLGGFLYFLTILITARVKMD